MLKKHLLVATIITLSIVSKSLLASDILTGASKVEFKEDKNFAEEHREHFKTEDNQKIEVAKLDLNEDGVEEYIVRISSETGCPSVGCSDVYEIYDKKFKKLFTNSSGYAGMYISKAISNDYKNILMECMTLNKEARRYIFSKKLQRYTIKLNSESLCTLSDEINRRLKNSSNQN